MHPPLDQGAIFTILLPIITLINWCQVSYIYSNLHKNGCMACKKPSGLVSKVVHPQLSHVYSGYSCHLSIVVTDAQEIRSEFEKRGHQHKSLTV